MKTIEEYTDGLAELEELMGIDDDKITPEHNARIDILSKEVEAYERQNITNQ